MNMENILFSKKVLLNSRLQFSADVNFKNPYQKLRRPLATKLQWPNFLQACMEYYRCAKHCWRVVVRFKAIDKTIVKQQTNTAEIRLSVGELQLVRRYL